MNKSEFSNILGSYFQKREYTYYEYQEVKKYFIMVLKHELKITNDEFCLLLLLYLNIINRIYFCLSNDYFRLRFYNNINSNYGDNNECSMLEEIPEILKIANKEFSNITKSPKKYLNNINVYNLYNINSKNNTVLFKDYFFIRSNKDICFERLRETSNYIYVEYLINDKKDFVSARKYINENGLFNHFNSYLKNSNSINEFWKSFNNFLKESLNKIFEYTNNYEFLELLSIDDLINKIDIEAEKSWYIKPLLKFYVSYYYLLEYENDEYAKNCLFKVLDIFRNGFGIEEFIDYCKLKKVTEGLKKLKVENIDDLEEIENSINEIHKYIEKEYHADIFDVENIKNIYSYINFDNLNPIVPQLIATGNIVKKTLDSSSISDFDYSSVIIEWSKAVEFEANDKLLIYGKNYLDKYHDNRANPKFKRDGKKANIKDTLGTFEYIREAKNDLNETLEDHLYDHVFSELYTKNFTKKKYKNLCDLIFEIIDYRNNAAHKNNILSKINAEECKDKILASEKILEILSHLKK